MAENLADAPPTTTREARLNVDDVINQLRAATVKDGADLFKRSTETLDSNATDLREDKERLWEVASSFEYYRYLGCQSEEEMRLRLNGPPASSATEDRSRAAKALREIRHNWGENFHLSVRWPVPAGEKMCTKTKAISKRISLEEFSSQINVIMEARIQGPSTRHARRDPVVMLSDVDSLDSKLRKKAGSKTPTGSVAGGDSDAESMMQASSKGKRKQSTLSSPSPAHPNESDYWETHSGDDQFAASSPPQTPTKRANQGVKRRKTALPRDLMTISQDPASPQIEVGRKAPPMGSYEDDTEMLASDGGGENRDENMPMSEGGNGKRLALVADESELVLGFGEEELVQTPASRRRELSLPIHEEKGFVGTASERGGRAPAILHDEELVGFGDETFELAAESGRWSPMQENYDGEPAGLQESPGSSMRVITLPSWPLSGNQNQASASGSHPRIASAIASLSQSGMLNDEAVNTCLEWELAITENSKFAVLNSFFFSPFRNEESSISDIASRELDKQIRGCPALQYPSDHTFLAPIHHPSSLHWSLVSIDFQEPSINHFDSYQSNDSFETIAAYVENWMRVVDLKLSGREVIRKQQLCPQQTDGVSCGDFLLVYAAAILRGENLLHCSISLVRHNYIQHLSSVNNHESPLEIANSSRGRRLFQRKQNPEGENHPSNTSKSAALPPNSMQDQQMQHASDQSLVSDQLNMARGGEDNRIFDGGYKRATVELQKYETEVNAVHKSADQAAEARAATQAEWLNLVTKSSGELARSEDPTTFIDASTKSISAAGAKHAQAAFEAVTTEEGVRAFELRHKKFKAVVAALLDFENTKSQTAQSVENVLAIMEKQSSVAEKSQDQGS